MNIVVNFFTPSHMWIIILFNWFLPKCHCDDPTEASSNSSRGSFERYSRKISDRFTNLSPSIVDRRHRGLQSLPEHILRHYDTEVLDLEDNRLTNLPIELANLTKIEYINLKANRVSNISSISVVNKLPNLEHLILSKNPLESLVGLRVRSLLYLEAVDCEIKKIDGAFLNSVRSLRSLNLTGNPLSVMEKLGSRNLTELVLKNCRMKGFHVDAFKGLPNLRYLEISGNELTTLPEKIFSNNNNLVQLIVGNNSLENIEKVWLRGKIQLRELDLSENKIGSIGKTVFANLAQLSKVDLSGNRVISLPNLTSTAIHLNLSRNNIKSEDSRDLSNMSRLQSLDLSKNRLEGDCDEFRSTSLLKLDLGYNKVKRITENSLSALPNLEDLILRGNRFTRAINLFFENNTNIVSLDLEDNPWHCDCSEMHPLYFYLSYDPKTTIANLRCATPEADSGNTWLNVCSRQWQFSMADDDRPNSNKAWFIGISISFVVCLLVGLLVHAGLVFLKTRRGINV